MFKVEQLSKFLLLSEILKKMDFHNDLNFKKLINVGNNLVFNITTNTTIIEIKNKSCQIWGLNESSYDLYDEMFNNLNICYDEKIIDLLNNKITDDSSNGILILYLIEKLNKNSDFFNTNNECIKKSQIKNDFSKNQISNDRELLTFLEMFKDEKILKGLHNYKPTKSGNRRSFLSSTRKFDNWCIFPILTIVYIILSIISISNKIVDESVKFATFNNLTHTGRIYTSLKFDKWNINHYLITYLNEVLEFSKYTDINSTYVIGNPTIRIVSFINQLDDELCY